MEKNLLSSTPAEGGEAPEACASPLPAWGIRESVFLLSALLAAGCYFFAHFPAVFAENWHLPGIGFAATQWALAAVFLCFAKKSGRLRAKKNPGGWFLLVAALLQGACFGIFANDSMRIMNLPVAALTCALALFSLTGTNPLPPLSGAGLITGFLGFLPACFSKTLLPFQHLKTLKLSGDQGKTRFLLIGLALCVPVAGVALALLSSADMFFQSFLKSLFTPAHRLDSGFFLRLVGTALFGLCLFSFLHAALERPLRPAQAMERQASPLTLIPALALLILFYGAFAYIQFQHLFFHSMDSIAAMGYAEYARSGFFQLSALAMLTLCMILLFLSLGKQSAAVRILCAGLAVLTIIIDYSAFLRMRLYIEAYGLSVLRLVTLWGMVMILCALIACVIKCIRPLLPICPALTVLALCTWLLLNFGNVDRIIARNQVNALNRGTLQQLDVRYLSSLSPEVMKELEHIQDPALRKQAMQQAKENLAAASPCAYDWSLSWLGFEEE